ncbi:hypothetical protein FACS1894176_01350 [Bacteroidia bacterium]|nr:hypothetical protein FACS1894176_01350 [Bacteroidia bacterium]
MTRTNIFATNTGYTQTFSDLVGNMNSTGIAINRIDKTAPYATNLSYNPSTNTNGSVTVTLTTNETVHLPVGRNGNVTGTTFTKTYSANETTSVAFYDLAGNLGSTGISITRIQTVKPGASLTYNPTTTTSGSVTATLTADKTILLPTGRSGTATGTVFTKVYTTNENSSFLITDTLGNTGEATVIITRIDKGDPTGSIAYSPSTATSGTVQATLSLNKTGTIILNNGGSPVYTFTGNGSFTFSYQAPNGVTGETTATVTRIDHIAPQIASLTYNPATTSVGPVMATLVLNESGSVP